MNLYYLSQTECRGYDTYSDCVVAAESEEAARLIHPGGGADYDWETEQRRSLAFRTWPAYPNHVKVEFIGVAASHVKMGVICASFHAG